MPDFNCDEMLRIGVTGDSIVRGVGDPNISDDNGGYVRNLQKFFPNAEFENIGVPGATSRSLFRAYKQNAFRGRITTQKLQDLDYLIIAVGTNDYWSKVPVTLTVRNIKRMKNFLESFYEKTDQVVPIIVVSTLPTTKRSFQQPFINSVNALLLTKRNIRDLNVRVRMHTLGQGIISSDNLHPSGKGYQRMAKYLSRVLLRNIKSMALNLRPDGDNDGIYDLFEEIRFFTDPTLFDTDGDGFSDGAEVFTHRTDPLDPNSRP